MPSMPVDVIHPLSPCARCRRVMVRRGKECDADGARWPGTVIFRAHGMCAGCVAAPGDHPRVEAKSLTSSLALAGSYRGPEMPQEATQAGYDAWLARRNKRLDTGTRRRAVRA